MTFCGNNHKEVGESCDGTDLAGASCGDFGFTGGSLSCSNSCTFNASQCTSAPSGGGGGGGGGGNFSPSPITAITSIIFEGQAYPLSKVVVLKDGQVAISTIAGPDANFNVTLTGLSAGNYTFAVYGEDSKGLRSSLFTFPVSITYGATTQVSGIFISPTIAVDKSEVAQGDNIAIFGQSIPNSTVTISVHSDPEIFNTVKTNTNGSYLFNFDTSALQMGDHLAKSKSTLAGAISSFGTAIGFTVGTKNVLLELPKVSSKSDVNSDGKVSIVDFSIEAYWYKRSSPPAFVDLNGDGKIDLTDFSIMAFNWTG